MMASLKIFSISLVILFLASIAMTKPVKQRNKLEERVTARHNRMFKSQGNVAIIFSLQVEMCDISVEPLFF